LMGIVQECACGRIARQTPRAVEDGERAIWVLVNPHRHLDVVVTVAVGGDLQDAVEVPDGIIVADDPFFLNTEDVLEEAGERTNAWPASSEVRANMTLWRRR
ncbi:MAG: hypothetical protein ACXW4O_10885, partial [Candidatus Binatia bacterium]